MLRRSISTETLAATLFATLLSGPALAQYEVAREDRNADLPSLVGTGLGTSLDVSGDRAIAGSVGDFATFDGSVFFFERDLSGAWVQTEIVLPTSASHRFFGAAVAMDGDRAAIGSPGPGNGTLPGEVLLLEYTGGWLGAATLSAPTPTNGDFFGTSLAVSGQRVLVGAPGDASGAGRVYVLERSVGGLWQHVADFTSGDPDAGDGFGTTVAWAGSRAIVSAPRDNAAAVDAGAVYVFEETAPGTWTEVTKLVASDAAPGDNFGLVLDAHGDRVAAGSPTKAITGARAGVAYVLEVDGSGTWSEVDEITIPNTVINIGFALALGSIAIGDEHVVLGYPGTIGGVFVAERRTDGTYRTSIQLAATDAPTGIFSSFGYGRRVAVDGSTLLVSAPGAGLPTFFGFTGRCYEYGLGQLYHGLRDVSIATPFPQNLHLRATDAHAGDIWYFMGSATGTSPGTFDPVSGLTLPLNYDAYTQLLLGTGFTFSGWFGQLDPNGEGEAAFVLPGGVSSSFAGKVLHHAYLVFDSTTFALSAISNATPVRLVN
ncbi:MAG: hypothetical protein R3F34_03445 [Planctomycetota bacterium]